MKTTRSAAPQLKSLTSRSKKGHKNLKSSIRPRNGRTMRSNRREGLDADTDHGELVEELSTLTLTMERSLVACQNYHLPRLYRTRTPLKGNFGVPALDCKINGADVGTKF